jgi:hypothetical protein
MSDITLNAGFRSKETEFYLTSVFTGNINVVIGIWYAVCAINYYMFQALVIIMLIFMMLLYDSLLTSHVVQQHAMSWKKTVTNRDGRPCRTPGG